MKTNHILFAAATAVALSAGAVQANNLSGNIPLSGSQGAVCEQRWNNGPTPSTLVVNLLTTSNQGFSSYNVRCNTNFTRTMSSANNGFLVGPLGTQIDYEFSIGGGGITSTGGFVDLNVPFVQSRSSSGGAIQTGSVTVRVKDTVVSGNIPAGLYSDTLTITVVPNP